MRKYSENIMKIVFLTAACVSIIAVILICVFLFASEMCIRDSTNTERRLQLVQAAIEEDVELANWEIAAEIAHVFEVDYEWENTEDISVAMNDEVPAYKYAVVDEVLGGVLKPADDARLAVIGDAKFADPIKCTDSLMNVIVERLPKPANPTA